MILGEIKLYPILNFISAITTVNNTKLKKMHYNYILLITINIKIYIKITFFNVKKIMQTLYFSVNYLLAFI